MKSILCAVFCMLMISAALTAFAAEDIVIPEISIERSPYEHNAALDFARGIRAGWNLGNTFDANGNHFTKANHMTAETSWVGVKTSRALIDAVAAAGFNALRIPVSWHNHVDADFTIDEKWLDRVQEVVDYAYDQGMYVILNIHHDCMKGYYYPSSDEYDTTERYVRAIWTQLAGRFADYGDKMIFEGINEPLLAGTSYEWSLNMSVAACKDAVACINRLNQTFVDTVRAAGGKNADRYLMVTPYAANYANAANAAFILPKDAAENKLIVSVHAYAPYLYALAGPDVAGSTDAFNLAKASDRSEIDTVMNRLYSRFIKNGVPVILGEYGSRDKSGNTQSRVDHAAYYVAAATARGIPCVWWDNHNFGKSGEAFGLIDRAKLEWRYPEIVEAIMRYSE